MPLYNLWTTSAEWYVIVDYELTTQRQVTMDELTISKFTSINADKLNNYINNCNSTVLA